MNKFLKSISLVIVYISILSLFISGNILLSYSNADFLNVATIKSDNYFSSQAFKNLADDDAVNIIKLSLYQSMFETDNKLDMDKSVDINELYNIYMINNYDTVNYNDLEYSGNSFRYRLLDLYEWSETIKDEGVARKTIYECHLDNSSRKFYSLEEYKELILSGKVYYKDINNNIYYKLEKFDNTFDTNNFENNTSLQKIEDIDVEEVLSDSDNIIFTSIISKSIYEELYFPIDGSSIIELSNSNKYFNDNFDIQIKKLETVLGEFSNYIEEYNNLSLDFKKGNTNISYTFRYAGIEFTNGLNLKEDNDYYFHIDNTLESANGNIKLEKAKIIKIFDLIDNSEDIWLDIVVDKNVKIEDKYFISYKSYQRFMPIVDSILFILVDSFILFTISIIVYVVNTRKLIYKNAIKDSKKGIDLIIFVSIITGLVAVLLPMLVDNIFKIPSFGGLKRIVLIEYTSVVIMSVAIYLFTRLFTKLHYRTYSDNLYIKKIKNNVKNIKKTVRTNVNIIFGYIITVVYNITAAASLMPILIVSAVVIDFIILIMIIKGLNNEKK